MSAFESSAVVRPGAEPAVAGSRETGIRETGHVRAVPPNMRGIRPGSYAGYPMNGMRLYACGGVECGCRSGLRWSVAPVKVCGMIARRPFAEQKSGPRALHVCAVCIWFASCAAEKVRGIGREEGRRGSCGKKGLEREARKRAAVPVAVLRAGRSVFRLSVSVYAGACRRGGSRLPFFYRVGQPSGTPAGTVYGDGCLCPHACFGGGAEDKKKETRSGHKPSDRFSFTNLKLLT